jgi:hypothetical protein
MEKCVKSMKRSESRKSIRPGGKSWKQKQRSVRKTQLQRMIERKRMLKK